MGHQSDKDKERRQMVIILTVQEDGFKIWYLNDKATWDWHPDFNNWYSYQDHYTHLNRFDA